MSFFYRFCFFTFCYHILVIPIIDLYYCLWRRWRVEVRSIACRVHVNDDSASSNQKDALFSGPLILIVWAERERERICARRPVHNSANDQEAVKGLR